MAVRWLHSTQHRTRLPWLFACCAVAEGAEVVFGGGGAGGAVAAALRDSQGRVAACGGREGMPRSLASVYAAIITLFLSERRLVRRVSAKTPRSPETRVACSTSDSFAVSRDGTTLFVCRIGTVFAFDIATGALRKALPFGRGEFLPLHVCVCDDDGLVFVFEWDRITVLTPELSQLCVICSRTLEFNTLSVACVNRNVIAIAGPRQVTGASLLCRRRHVRLHTLGGDDAGDAASEDIRGLCFLNDGRDLALCDFTKHRVVVFAIDRREVVRILRLDGFTQPLHIAATLDTEVVCINYAGTCVVFGDGGASIVATSAYNKTVYFGTFWDVRRLGATNSLVVCKGFCQDFSCSRRGFYALFWRHEKPPCKKSSFCLIPFQIEKPQNNL
jgi:hypothetical protein